jgi:transposase-like protein
MANPVLNHPRFHEEQAAYDWVEAIVWANGRVCPHCGVFDRSGPLKGKTNRIGLYKCYACRKPFTVKVGTIFEDSHAAMHLWMQAMYLMCSSKKGFSTNQLARTLGVHMKTAWHMTHRIRLAMGDHSDVFGPIGGAGQTIEVDETFWGRKEGAEHVDPWQFSNAGGWSKGGRGAPGRARPKVPVVTLVERGGKARSIKAENVTARELRRIVFAHADIRSDLMTDQARAYRGIGRAFRSHESVNHSINEWVRGAAHTNTVEGFFSVFKRGMRGTYQHCAERHLHRYLAEFDFRFNNRVALGVGDEERTDRLIRGIVGKRLTYRETIDAGKAKTS